MKNDSTSPTYSHYIDDAIGADSHTASMLLLMYEIINDTKMTTNIHNNLKNDNYMDHNNKDTNHKQRNLSIGILHTN